MTHLYKIRDRRLGKAVPPPSVGQQLGRRQLERRSGEGEGYRNMRVWTRIGGDPPMASARCWAPPAKTQESPALKAVASVPETVPEDTMPETVPETTTPEAAPETTAAEIAEKLERLGNRLDAAVDAVRSAGERFGEAAAGLGDRFAEIARCVGSGLGDVARAVEEAKDAIARAGSSAQDGMGGVAARLEETAKALRDAGPSMTPEELRDVLTYTTIPVIITDHGPAPKRPA